MQQVNNKMKVLFPSFDEKQIIGQYRCLFKQFLQYRENSFGGSYGNSFMDNQTSKKIKNSADNDFDLDKECQRLIEGFKESFKNSLHGMFLNGILKVPEWKKSSLWVNGNTTTICFGCRKEFCLRRGRHNCVICGSVICSHCSTKDLLIYIPDELTDDSSQTEVHLAIIRIIGCPENEPQICNYLRICHKCNLLIQDRQISEFQVVQHKFQQNNDLLLQISQTNDQFKFFQHRIEAFFPKYCELLEVRDIGPNSSLIPSNRTDLQVLATAQLYLLGNITSLVTSVVGMTRVKPVSKPQMVFLRNCIQSRLDCYYEYMFQFGELQKQLRTTVPKDILMETQIIVRRNVISSCYLSIKQLALEVFYLSHKHKLNIKILQKLMAVEEVVQEELKSIWNESWSTEAKIINHFLKMQLKNHRLIQPSEQLISQFGNRHVMAVILETTEAILHQMFLQLQAKSSDKEFIMIKSAIRLLILELSESY